MKFSKALEEDIEHKLDCVGEPSEENDFQTFTRSDAVMELMQDMDMPDHYAYEHRNELRIFGICCGVFKEITQKEMDNMTVWSSSGRHCKKYDFKKNGKFYIFNTWDKLPDDI